MSLKSLAELGPRGKLPRFWRNLQPLCGVSHGGFATLCILEVVIVKRTRLNVNWIQPKPLAGVSYELECQTKLKRVLHYDFPDKAINMRDDTQGELTLLGTTLPGRLIALLTFRSPCPSKSVNGLPLIIF